MITRRCSYFSKRWGTRVSLCAVPLTRCQRSAHAWRVTSPLIETLAQTNLFWHIANISSSTISSRPSSEFCGPTFDERYGHPLDWVLPVINTFWFDINTFIHSRTVFILARHTGWNIDNKSRTRVTGAFAVWQVERREWNARVRGRSMQMNNVHC